MGEKPTVEEIMEAIDASGYLMEQKVGTQLEKRGMHVRTNVAFEDPDEGKSREMDVNAFLQAGRNEEAKLAVNIELVVECKNNSSPFVFIARPKNRVDLKAPPLELQFPYKYQMQKDLGGGRAMSRDVAAFTHLGFDDVYSEHLNPLKAVQFCKIDRNGRDKWTANHGGLYDAMFYPMAKAITARRSEIPRARNPDDWRFFWFLFPLVVTSSDIFLIDSGDENPSPRAVDHVTFRRELKSAKLSGSFMLTFVRQSALEEFLVSVVDPVAQRATDLITNELSRVKQVMLPWTD